MAGRRRTSQSVRPAGTPARPGLGGATTGALVEAQLEEDLGHVGLDGALGDDRAAAAIALLDRPSSDEREHLALRAG